MYDKIFDTMLSLQRNERQLMAMFMQQRYRWKQKLNHRQKTTKVVGLHRQNSKLKVNNI